MEMRSVVPGAVVTSGNNNMLENTIATYCRASFYRLGHVPDRSVTSILQLKNTDRD